MFVKENANREKRKENLESITFTNLEYERDKLCIFFLGETSALNSWCLDVFYYLVHIQVISTISMINIYLSHSQSLKRNEKCLKCMDVYYELLQRRIQNPDKHL